MIKDSDKKLFDIVLVWKLDRFARNRYDSARYKTQLKKNGVKPVSYTHLAKSFGKPTVTSSFIKKVTYRVDCFCQRILDSGNAEHILSLIHICRHWKIAF